MYCECSYSNKCFNQFKKDGRGEVDEQDEHLALDSDNEYNLAVLAFVITEYVLDILGTSVGPTSVMCSSIGLDTMKPLQMHFVWRVLKAQVIFTLKTDVDSMPLINVIRIIKYYKLGIMITVLMFWSQITLNLTFDLDVDL